MSALQAHQGQPWHNPIPSWIREHRDYQSMRSQFKRTLQTIANAGNLGPAGSITGTFGGAALCKAAGVGRSTFWRHLDRLARLGFVVPLGRGGTIGSRNYANQYGIPGQPGALDSRRCRRRMQRRIRGEDGRWTVQIIAPGDSPTLFAQQRGNPAQQRRGDQKWDGGSPKVGRGSSHYGTQPSPLTSPEECKNKNHGVSRGVSRGKPARGPNIRAVTVQDLTDTGRLMILLAQAIEAKWIGRGEHDRLRFVGAAVRALRLGDNPPGMFISTVKHERWLWISGDDEDEANRRIKAHIHGPRDRGDDRPMDESEFYG